MMLPAHSYFFRDPVVNPCVGYGDDGWTYCLETDRCYRYTGAAMVNWRSAVSLCLDLGDGAMLVRKNRERPRLSPLLS